MSKSYAESPVRKKTVVITGSAGCIGSATLALFSHHGWRTVGVDRNETLGADCALTLDLARFEDLALLADKVRRMPQIDAIIHIAAEQPEGHLHDTAVSTWVSAMSANVFALAEICRAARAQLIAARGSIVAVTSVHSRATSPGLLVYSTTKSALAGLVRALAVELAPSGVRANAIAPGAVDTPMLQQGLMRFGDVARARKDLLSKIPAGRLADGDEIAQVIYFLTQPFAGYITGQEFLVDGGVSVSLSSESEL